MQIKQVSWHHANLSAWIDAGRAGRVWDLTGAPQAQGRPVYLGDGEGEGFVVATGEPPTWMPRPRDQAQDPAEPARTTSHLWQPCVLDKKTFDFVKDLDDGSIVIVQEHVAGLVKRAVRPGVVVLVPRRDADGELLLLAAR